MKAAAESGEMGARCFMSIVVYRNLGGELDGWHQGTGRPDIVGPQTEENGDGGGLAWMWEKVTGRVMRCDRMGRESGAGAVCCDADAKCNAKRSKSGRGSTTVGVHMSAHLAARTFIFPWQRKRKTENVVSGCPCVTEAARWHAVPSRSGRESGKETPSRPRRVAHVDNKDEQSATSTTMAWNRQEQQQSKIVPREPGNWKLGLREQRRVRISHLGTQDSKVVLNGRLEDVEGWMENGNFANCHGDGARFARDSTRIRSVPLLVNSKLKHLSRGGDRASEHAG